MIFDFIFPPICIHCEETTKSSKFPLCSTCFASLEKINPEERCFKCFSEKSAEVFFCKKCRDYPLGLQGVAATFEYLGVVASLFNEWKKCHRPALSQGLSAFMALQLLKLNWPSFDLIVPIPQTFLRKMSLGFNPACLLAENLSKIIDVPVGSCLVKKMGVPPQMRLSREERKNLTPSVFAWEKGDICGKTILLVDDLIGTGSTLKNAALSLKGGLPKAIYGLTFCAC